MVDDEEEEVEDVTLSSKSVDVDFNRNGDEGTSGGGGKAARLPRWTRQEILVLIQGKRVAENRVRRGRSAALCDQQQQAEPKWATVSSYCKRHGVNRGPVQCRKRWSNLAGDYKKIKEWDSQIKDEAESFWLMRNDVRRDRKLPGFFDREVFDILNSNSSAPTQSSDTLPQQLVMEPLFDSGRSAATEDGLFSDFEQQHQQQHQAQEYENERNPDNEVQPHVMPPPPPMVSPIPTPTPISGTPSPFSIGRLEIPL